MLEQRMYNEVIPDNDSSIFRVKVYKRFQVSLRVNNEEHSKEGEDDDTSEDVY